MKREVNFIFNSLKIIIREVIVKRYRKEGALHMLYT